MSLVTTSDNRVLVLMQQAVRMYTEISCAWPWYRIDIIKTSKLSGHARDFLIVSRSFNSIYKV